MSSSMSSVCLCVEIILGKDEITHHFIHLFVHSNGIDVRNRILNPVIVCITLSYSYITLDKQQKRLLQGKKETGDIEMRGVRFIVFFSFIEYLIGDTFFHPSTMERNSNFTGSDSERCNFPFNGRDG